MLSMTFLRTILCKNHIMRIGNETMRLFDYIALKYRPISKPV
jgi:hypothetical protein